MSFDLTDLNIEIPCSECDTIIQGLDCMIGHIIEKHPQYTAAEAMVYARKWCDRAYENSEQWERLYKEDREIDRSIDADIEFQEHHI